MASNDTPPPLLTRKTVLLVDDAPDNLVLVNDLLKDYYKIKIANSGERALRIAQAVPGPDLILLDIMMPEMDGYEVCRRLKANPATRHIPIIFLTAKTDADAERQGLDLGAVDYITKPISPAIAMARVRNHLLLKDSADFLRDQNEFLEREIASRTQEVMAIQDVTILAMASMAETRDSETGNHIRRTQHYVKALAQRLQDHPRFAATLTDQFIGLLYKSAPLHDIGKVGIPDRILLKPGHLDREEFEIMKMHAVYGRDTIMLVEKHIGGSNSFLMYAREVAHSHQEKWDGSGYPQNLVGEEIPLSARLMAVADVYDALISKRVYKPAFTHEQALDVMRKGRGSHFDPDVLDAFLAIETEFARIASAFADGGD
jgi:putative two-component system response regulator